MKTEAFLERKCYRIEIHFKKTYIFLLHIIGNNGRLCYTKLKLGRPEHTAQCTLVQNEIISFRNYFHKNFVIRHLNRLINMQKSQKSFHFSIIFFITFILQFCQFYLMKSILFRLNLSCKISYNFVQQNLSTLG